jgi:hypothetical protein
MIHCPLLDGLYGIALMLDRGHPDMAAHLRAVAQELRETRGHLRLAMDLLATESAHVEALLDDTSEELCTH